MMYDIMTTFHNLASITATTCTALYNLSSTQSQDCEVIYQSAQMTNNTKSFIQKMVGKIIFNVCAIYNTLLVTLRYLAAQQNSPTVDNSEDMMQLLNYCASNPN